MTVRKSSFAPVADHRTKVLVLGSLPGNASLQAKQYYAKPSNQFWLMIGAVIEQDLASLPYATRLDRLLDARIGLWDVIADAEREGSLDAEIRNHRETQFVELAAALPQVRALAFNGGKSAKIGMRRMGPNSPFEAVSLPSSSAAYCSITFADKLDRWRAVKEFLD